MATEDDFKSAQDSGEVYDFRPKKKDGTDIRGRVTGPDRSIVTTPERGPGRGWKVEDERGNGHTIAPEDYEISRVMSVTAAPNQGASPPRARPSSEDVEGEPKAVGLLLAELLTSKSTRATDVVWATVPKDTAQSLRKAITDDRFDADVDLTSLRTVSFGEPSRTVVAATVFNDDTEAAAGVYAAEGSTILLKVTRQWS